MSRAKQNFVDISGMDWMISYVRWASRHLPSGGNNFSVIADVADDFCFDDLYCKVMELKNIRQFLAGKVKRSWRNYRPYWYYGSSRGEGIICTIDRQSEDVSVSNVLPEGTAHKIIYFERRKQLLFTFSHAVFDGVGAEKYISQLLQHTLADEVPVRNIPINVPAMKESGRKLQTLMKEFPEKKILLLPARCSNRTNDFTTVQLPPEQYTLLEKSVEKKYGPFSLSLFVFALILCGLEKYVFPAESKKEYVFVPMSVDMRNSHKESVDMFFNHWSLMPLLIDRKVLREGVAAAVQHLRMLYSRQLASRTPQLFDQAAEAMKYVPFRGIDLMVKCKPAQTLGTVMFSFLNSSNCGGKYLNNIVHYPNMPYGNNLGFFVNVYNGKLNIVISRRAWQDNGAFDVFCNELRSCLQEEII